MDKKSKIKTVHVVVVITLIFLIGLGSLLGFGIYYYVKIKQKIEQRNEEISKMPMLTEEDAKKMATESIIDGGEKNINDYEEPVVLTEEATPLVFDVYQGVIENVSKKEKEGFFLVGYSPKDKEKEPVLILFIHKKTGETLGIIENYEMINTFGEGPLLDL